jgi:hypothetical protein
MARQAGGALARLASPRPSANALTVARVGMGAFTPAAGVHAGSGHHRLHGAEAWRSVSTAVTRERPRSCMSCPATASHEGTVPLESCASSASDWKVALGVFEQIQSRFDAARTHLTLAALERERAHGDRAVAHRETADGCSASWA